MCGVVEVLLAAVRCRSAAPRAARRRVVGGTRRVALAAALPLLVRRCRGLEMVRKRSPSKAETYVPWRFNGLERWCHLCSPSPQARLGCSVAPVGPCLVKERPSSNGPTFPPRYARKESLAGGSPWVAGQLEPSHRARVSSSIYLPHPSSIIKPGSRVFRPPIFCDSFSCPLSRQTSLPTSCS